MHSKSNQTALGALMAPHLAHLTVNIRVVLLQAQQRAHVAKEKETMSTIANGCGEDRWFRSRGRGGAPRLHGLRGDWLGGDRLAALHDLLYPTIPEHVVVAPLQQGASLREPSRRALSEGILSKGPLKVAKGPIQGPPQSLRGTHPRDPTSKGPIQGAQPPRVPKGPHLHRAYIILELY